MLHLPFVVIQQFGQTECEDEVNDHCNEQWQNSAIRNGCHDSCLENQLTDTNNGNDGTFLNHRDEFISKCRPNIFQRLWKYNIPHSCSFAHSKTSGSFLLTSRN